MGTKIVQPGPRQAPANQASPRTVGLGDAVEAVAKPIARVFGIEDCAPCQRRKAALNALSDRAASGIRNLFRRR